MSIGGTSEVVNDSYSVSKNKVVKYPFEFIQSLQNRFGLDDETATKKNGSDTTNDSSSTITHEGKVRAQLSLNHIIWSINFMYVIEVQLNQILQVQTNYIAKRSCKVNKHQLYIIWQ